MRMDIDQVLSQLEGKKYEVFFVEFVSIVCFIKLLCTFLTDLTLDYKLLKGLGLSYSHLAIVELPKRKI